MEPIGVYLHLPFCAAKCPYCDFYSLRAGARSWDAFTQAACSRLAEWGARLRRPADTLYLGGGTPSLLGGRRISRLLHAARAAFGLEGAEITVECNPSCVTPDFFTQIRAAGANRISMGLQSADSAERRALGRRADGEQAARAVGWAKAAGFSNISLDLMLGIPGQTAQSLRRSIDFCIRQEVCHVSAYLLKIEEGTPFAARQGALSLPDEDTVCDLYERTCVLLERNGLPQYEISNFAQPGFESRHNLKYWDCREYLGVGPAAHSFLAGRRFYYPRDLDGFLQGNEPTPDGSGGDFEEYAMLRLRLTRGLTERDVRARFGGGIPGGLRARAQPLQGYGLLVSDADGIRLTRKGFLVSNAVLAQLL